MQVNQVELLLVEDNPNDLELTLHAFEKHRLTNCIHVARDGAEALDFIFCTGKHAKREGEHRPLMVLLDLKLPKIDGIEVLRRIRSDARTKSLPVVVLTSSMQESDVNECYALGVNSYILKPVDFDKFVETAYTLGLYWIVMNVPPASPGQSYKSVGISSNTHD